MLKNGTTFKYIFFLVFLTGIGLISFVFERHQTSIVLPVYFVCFIAYWYIIKHEGFFSLKKLFVFGIVCRIILIPSTPVLSDDVYRFIWDGRLLSQDISPFANIPAYYLDHVNDALIGINSALFTKLNSPNYFTVYPPVAQFVFWISTFPFLINEWASIIVIRILSISAEVGAMYFTIKILKHYKLPLVNSLYYFLNPLVIIELTGSLHFEAFMLLFLFGGFYFYLQKQFVLSGTFWALAVGVKLIPLIFLPYLLFKNSLKNNVIFFTALSVTILLIFTPIMDKNLLYGLSESLSLYFQYFEFNASIYYLVREIGYLTTGYNIIATSGKVLAIVSFSFIIALSIISWKNKWGTAATLVIILLTYFMFTNILHPWYIVSILALSIFTQFKFTIIWSGLIFLTYAGYSQSGYNEYLWLVAIEYLVTIGVVIYELWTKHPLKTSNYEK